MNYEDRNAYRQWLESIPCEPDPNAFSWEWINGEFYITPRQKLNVFTFYADIRYKEDWEFARF